MALLDSLLAFALTLAALATVATLILEIAFRALRLKRIGQMRMVELMLDQATGLRDGTLAAPPAGRDARIGALLANPFAVDLWGFFRNLWVYWRKCSAIYEDVSLEHTLRNLVDIVGQPAQGAADAAKEIGDKLEALGRKYDEYCGALAARYKHNAQRWSLVVGVLLAFGMNIDGFRVLEVYLQDPDLRQRAIEQLQPREAEESETDAAPPEAAEESAAEESAAEDAAAEESEVPPEAAEVPEAAEADSDAQLKELQQKYDDLRSQVATIAGLDLPIGWSYFPSCIRLGDDGAPLPSTDPRCPEKGETGWDPTTKAFWSWLIQVLATGLLIGLGAPFWYDVARRLAEVRTAFGGKGTTEQQFRGDDGRDGPLARKQLVQRIVQDFLTLGSQPGQAGEADPKPQES